MAANDSNPDPNTSVVAVSAILLALTARDRHGIGQMVRVNMQVANVWANSDGFLSYANKPARAPVDAGHNGLGALYRLYPTADGWVFLAAPTDREFRRFCSAVGHDELGDDQRFVTAELRAINDADLAEAIERCLGDGPGDSEA